MGLSCCWDVTTVTDKITAVAATTLLGCCGMKRDTAAGFLYQIW